MICSAQGLNRFSFKCIVYLSKVVSWCQITLFNCDWCLNFNYNWFLTSHNGFQTLNQLYFVVQERWLWKTDNLFLFIFSHMWIVTMLYEKLSPLVEVMGIYFHACVSNRTELCRWFNTCPSVSFTYTGCNCDAILPGNHNSLSPQSRKHTGISICCHAFRTNLEPLVKC